LQREKGPPRRVSKRSGGLLQREIGTAVWGELKGINAKQGDLGEVRVGKRHVRDGVGNTNFGKKTRRGSDSRGEVE